MHPSWRLVRRALAVLAMSFPVGAFAAVSTTTSLTVAPNASSEAGSVITLTAKVVDARSAPVTAGTVNFCMGAQGACMSQNLLGAAQLITAAGATQGTATLKLRLGAGSYSFYVMYLGTSADARSTSAASAFTVTPLTVPGATTTTLSDTGTPGNYSLTATVAGNGTAPLSGSVSFLSPANSTTSIGTAALGESTAGYNYTPAPGGTITIPPTGGAIGSAGGSPIAVADFNGDGIPDLLLKAAGETMYGERNLPYPYGALFVALGDGKGGFNLLGKSGYGVAFAVGEIDSAVVQDLNGDGIPDIVYSDTEYQPDVYAYLPYVRVLLGQGDGTFAFQPNTAVNNPRTLSSLGVVDANGDGFSDIFVSDPEGNFHLWLNDGTGKFSEASESPFSLSHTSIASGDFNGDGILDVLTTDYSTQLSVYLGDGQGRFTPAPQLPVSTPHGVYLASAADLNGDGALDLVASYSTDGSVGVFWGDGHGGFSSAGTPYTVGATLQGAIAIHLADLNGDSALDIVTENQDGTLGVLIGDGTGRFTTASNSPLSDGSNLQAQLFKIADFNEDGIPDLIVSKGNVPTIWLGDGAGQFSILGSPTSPQPPASSFQPRLIQDLDGDGRPDLIAKTGSGIQGFLTEDTQTATATLSNANLAGSSITTVVANYPGDTNYLSSSSNVVQVGRYSANLSVTTPGKLIFDSGEPVPLTLSFTAAADSTRAPAPTGSVSLVANGTVLASNTLPSNLPWTMPVSRMFATPGTYSIVLQYAGDSNWNAATSSPLTITVRPNTFTLSSNLTASLTAVAGTTLTFTATSSVPSGTTPPSGTIQFYDGNKAIGPSIPTGEDASYTSASFSLGAHSLTAVLTDTASMLTFTTPSIAFTEVSSGPDAATLTLVNTSAVTGGVVYPGIPLQYTGFITLGALGPAPTGVMYLQLDGAAIASLPVSATPASFPQVNTAAHPFTPGNHSLKLSYVADANWTASTSTAIDLHVTNATATTLAWTNPPVTGTVAVATPVTLTAQLGTSSTSSVKASGTLTLSDNGKALQTQTVNAALPIDSTFSVNTAATPLSAGSHAFTLAYSGDANWYSATTKAQTVNVTGTTPTIALTSNGGAYPSTVLGSAVTFTAAIAGSSGSPAPTGAVQFSIDNVAAGSPVNVSAGAASFTTSTLPAGAHTLAAAYSGDSLYTAATAQSAITVVAQGADSLTASLSGPTTVPVGTPIPITGSLSVASFGPTPTGAVELIDNGSRIASTSLTGNPPFALSFTINTAAAPLSAGAHSLSLKYDGSSTWSTATSASIAVTITPVTVPSVTINLTSSAASVTAGSSVTFTAALTQTSGAPMPTGTVQFYDGAAALGSPAPLTNAVATYSTAALAGGTHSITAAYSGDANYPALTSTALAQSIEDFTFQAANPTLTVTPGSSASVKLTIAAEGGLNASTTFSCTGLPTGAACAFSPATLTGGGTTTLAISTTGAQSAAVHSSSPWLARGGVAFACLLLLGLPDRRKAQWLSLLLLALFLATAQGCGSSSASPTQPGGGASATPAGNYSVSVAAVTGTGPSAITHTTTLQLTVN